MSILDSFKAAVSAFFSKAVAVIKEFATAFLPQAGQLVEVAIEDVAEIAGKAVLDEAQKVLSGQEKFDSAVATVVAEVAAQGKTIAINTAKAAVQLAYLEAQKIAQGN